MENFPTGNRSLDALHSKDIVQDSIHIFNLVGSWLKNFSHYVSSQFDATL